MNGSQDLQYEHAVAERGWAMFGPFAEHPLVRLRVELTYIWRHLSHRGKVFVLETIWIVYKSRLSFDRHFDRIGLVIKNAILIMVVHYHSFMDG